MKSKKLKHVWITIACRGQVEVKDHPEVGLWADETKDQAEMRVAAVNAKGSWLREIGYRARVAGKTAFPHPRPRTQ